MPCADRCRSVQMPCADLPGKIRDSQGAAHTTQSWLPDARVDHVPSRRHAGQTRDMQPMGPLLSAVMGPQPVTSQSLGR